eukprot:gnl/TRDRNA2_/TRDRNA2_171176_c9_seq6.p1 gnl/TRDRNA2_/TRDRNA2_171176_c9~~gnl/TRDRNA2_/TRDRNA2_171176_c9_seq6.p1  ORF type:complete len:940 (-),score=124.95 gnl/TRDRNA2_/TRDRNA2_171176_c9_seq6:162-2981(-)
MRLLHILFCIVIASTAECAHHHLRHEGLEDPPDRKDTSVVDKEVEQTRKNSKVAKDRVEHAPRSLPRRVREDIDLLVNTFMPSWKFRLRVFVHAVSVVAWSIAWFLLYFFFIYTKDCDEHLERWEAEVESTPAALHQDRPQILADLILVFHHPDYPYDDVTARVSHGAVNRALPDCHNSDPTEFQKIQAEIKKFHDPTSASEYMQAATDSVKATVSPRRGGDPADADRPTMHSVRTAILQDVYAYLRNCGFDVTIFSSIDDDELYVCVSLTREEVMEKYLLTQNTELPVHWAVVKSLGVVQPPEEPESSPPLIRYDPRIVERLYRAGVLLKNDPRELYQSGHHAPPHLKGQEKSGWSPTGSRNGSPSKVPVLEKVTILSGSQRVDIVERELTDRVNLDAAVEEGLLAGWYPAHNEHWLVKLRVTWASWRRCMDLSFVQPIPMIKTYYGPRVAFIFLWNGLYCKALLALLPIALVLEWTFFIDSLFFGESADSKTQVLGFLIVLVIWARIVSNLWEREQEYFVRLWELDPNEGDAVGTVRPEFHGTLQPSPADASHMEKQYPANMSMCRHVFSVIVTALFCVWVAVFISVWMTIFDQSLETLISSICLSILIKIFEFTWNYLVVVLTEFENHRLKESYYNSYLWKQFLVQSVINYLAFCYIAVRQNWTEAGCGEGSCLSLLRLQLTMTLGILSLCRMGQVLFSSVMVRFSLWYETYKLQQQLGKDREVAKRSFAEEQSKYAEYRIREQVEGMLQLVLSLGYILIFGAVAPITVPMCFAVFVVQLRATAHMICTTAKRSVPRKQIGIGNWQYCVALLMKIGVLFEGFLIVSFGESFKGTQLLAKLTGLILIFIAGIIIWAMVDGIVPAVDDEAELLTKRRDYTQKKILKATGGLAAATKGFESIGVNSITLKARDQVHKCMEEGHWDAIPHLDGSPVKRNK